MENQLLLGVLWLPSGESDVGEGGVRHINERMNIHASLPCVIEEIMLRQSTCILVSENIAHFGQP